MSFISALKCIEHMQLCSFKRHFMSATVAPRMNEGNQITLYRPGRMSLEASEFRYNGDEVLKIVA